MTDKPTAKVREPKIGEGKRGRSGHLIYLLRQANTAMRQALDRELFELGLTFPQYSALTMINAHPGLSSAELARISMLTPQSTNETVQRLEAAGWAMRASVPGEGRAMRLEITASGRKVLGLARACTDRIENRLVRLMAGDAAIAAWLVAVAVAFGEEDVAEPASSGIRP